MNRRLTCAVILSVLVMALGGVAAQAAAHPDQEIRYAEFIQPWDSAAIAPAAAGGHAIWSFDALGEIFDIELTSNARLIENMPAARQAEILAENILLQGTLLDNPGSWVRLSETAVGGINGMIWNGEELFVIEPALAVEDQLTLDTPLARNDDRLAIFRYTDLVHPGFDCGADHGRIGSPTQPLANQDANLGIFGTLDVIVVQDQSWSGDTFGLYNTVDGIYASQIGANIAIFSTENANLFPPNPVSNTYLGVFDSYMGNRANSVGAGHLMSGRNDTGWAGIAYLTRLCTSLSHGITVDFGFSSTVTILAHEIGHNSDAFHDQDVGCGTGFIMDAFVSGSQTFSSCSTSRMIPHMSGKSCITDGDPPGGSDFCFAFDGFCDGLGLSASGGVVTGNWENYDCAGSNEPVVGTVNASQGEIFCDGISGACNVTPGTEWSFVIDRPLDSTMDMFQNGNIWIDELGYNLSNGNCAFAQSGNVSTIGAAE